MHQLMRGDTCSRACWCKLADAAQPGSGRLGTLGFSGIEQFGAANSLTLLPGLYMQQQDIVSAVLRSQC
jgi:hypothetical protein